MYEEIRKSVALCNRMSSHRDLPFHETCRSEQGSLDAGNKLSRNKIVQLVRFLAVNEALIKLRWAFPASTSPQARPLKLVALLF
ncbi:hypothetical protein AVEN_102190-1 [Araneus ventricosus]|uniref:Uncharacterized protein n=1 Tax=Araneus ventricosus TaxID=182803 RepID=A0A4Y2QJH4_ARAVE|nr:hypothetical protein AVEN_102190-1 [Araneus ventricosus]